MNALGKTLPLALLLTLAGAAQAADAPGAPAAAPTAAPAAAAREPDPAAMTARMTRNLGLSPEQAARVGTINEQFATRMQEHRAQADKMREAHRAAMENIVADREAELKNVLTEEQYRQHQEQMQAIQERQRDHRGPGAGMGPHGPGPGMGQRGPAAAQDAQSPPAE